MNAPNFASTPDVQGAVVNTANTSVTGATGTVATVFTSPAGGNGSRIDFAQIKRIVAVGTEGAADTVRFFLQSPANTILALREVGIPSDGAVVSVTVTNAEAIVSLGISVPAGWALLATTNVGGATASYHVTVFAADF